MAAGDHRCVHAVGDYRSFAGAHLFCNLEHPPEVIVYHYFGLRSGDGRNTDRQEPDGNLHVQSGGDGHDPVPSQSVYHSDNNDSSGDAGLCGVGFLYLTDEQQI